MAAIAHFHHPFNMSSQVHQRCKCSNLTICGEEEQTVLRLAKEGKIKSNYVFT